MLKFGPADSQNMHVALLKLLNEMKTCEDDPGDQELLHVLTLQSDTTDIWGTLVRGEYGQLQKVYSRATLAEELTLTKEHAPMRQFYFRFHLPAGATRGFLTISLTGQHSALHRLRKRLVAGFAGQYSQYRLYIIRTIHGETLNDILTGRVMSYQVRTTQVSSDTADLVRVPQDDAALSTISMTVKAKRGMGLFQDAKPTWMTRTLTGTPLAELWPEATSLKVTIKYNGRSHTFNLAKTDNIAPHIEVTPKVTFDENGLVTFDSIDAVCRGIRDDLVNRDAAGAVDA